MEPSNNNRRASDEKIERLVADVDLLKAQMKENTEVTKQVRDILSSFKIIGFIVKWCTAIVIFITSVKVGFDSFWGGK